jgi:hypothetical protein
MRTTFAVVLPMSMPREQRAEDPEAVIASKLLK